MRKLLPALALLLLTPACGEAAAERAREDGAQRFAADLEPLNGSGVRGDGSLSLAGPHLTVRIEASGLVPNRIHEQHIQGLVVADEEATCPSPQEDDDGDDLVELREARSAFGRSIRALEPFPTLGEDGRLDYDLTLTADPRELEPLENRVLVLRGRSVDARGAGGEEYRPDLPVACGELRALGERGP